MFNIVPASYSAARFLSGCTSVLLQDEPDFTPSSTDISSMGIGNMIVALRSPAMLLRVPR